MSGSRLSTNYCEGRFNDLSSIPWPCGPGLIANPVHWNGLCDGWAQGSTLELGDGGDYSWYVLLRSDYHRRSDAMQVLRKLISGVPSFLLVGGVNVVDRVCPIGRRSTCQ